MIFDKLFKKDKDSSKTTESKPVSEMDYYAEGKAQFNAGHYTQAMEYFQAAIAEHPERENAYLKLADSFLAIGKQKEASSTLYQLLARYPESTQAQEMLKKCQPKPTPEPPRKRDDVSFSIDDEFARLNSGTVSNNQPDPVFTVVDPPTTPTTPQPAPPQPRHFSSNDPYDPHLDLADYTMPNIDLLEDAPTVKCSLKNLLQSQEFTNTLAALPVVMGADVKGQPHIIDLTELPHMLISGLTGFGKTTFLNAMLTSLLYKKHPSELKLVIMGDRRLSLTMWDSLDRHYLIALPDNDQPVIIDNTKLAVRTLNSLCIEMDSRFDLLKAAKVRNIKDYNDDFCHRKLNPIHGHRYLPYIVVAIYEFAGYMASGGKEIELPICRLAQLARAVGIHIVIASNRSDADIFTTQMKSNFPARLSFKVARGIESNAILGVSGAQNLKYAGEILFSPPGVAPMHLNGAYISDDDVDKVIRYVSNQRGYPFNYELPEYLDPNEEPRKEFDARHKDEFFNDAARLVVASQFGSTSLLQRKLQLGYNRAGRIIDQLEAAGIVGPSNGSNLRDVLIHDEVKLEELLKRL